MSRRKKRRIDIVDGQPIVDEDTARMLESHGQQAVPFCGELMTCLICQRQERSDSCVESNWRLVVADGVRYYFCPAEFPPDAIATGKLFKLAYQRAMLAVTITREGLSLTLDVFRPVDWASDSKP